MKQYKNHQEVPSKYKWDLSFLLEGKTIEERVEELINLSKEKVKLKDSKFVSADSYLKWLKLEDKIEIKHLKVHNFLSNSISLNVIDPKITALSQKLDYELALIDEQLGAERAEFFAHAKELAKWAQLPEYKEYKRSIESALEAAKYQLPKEIEEFRNTEARADVSAHQVFSILTNSELNYGFATTKKGAKIKVTPANRTELAKHSDALVRKTSAKSFAQAFLNHKGSLSSLLFQHKKKEATWSKIYGYNSSIEMFLFADRAPKELLTTLYTATQQNKSIFVAYENATKKFYFAKYKEKMTKYDKARELSSVNKKYTPEEGNELVLNSIKPFGDEYVSVVKKGLAENWVDYCPVQNKGSGAYSIGGTYNIEKKLIFMNWDDDFRSVETLAHEWGHSMHSYFSTKAHGLRDSSYRIFVAEIASIFNELMLRDYILSTSDDDQLKFKIAKESVDGFIGTVMRQTEWSNYEYDFYEALDKGTPLGSYDAISKLYFENAKKYANKKLTYKADDLFPSIYVPHFYYGFYVYKYAIGQLVANIFFQKYKQEGVSALKLFIEKFLSAGGSKDPIDILKDAGVDLLDPKVYELGFKACEENIKEYIKLGNKIFKIKK